MQVKSCYLIIKIKSYDNNYRRVSGRSVELKLVQIQNPIYVFEIQNRFNQKPNILNLCVCIVNLSISYYSNLYKMDLKHKL